jgi:hypothetical protein
VFDRLSTGVGAVEMRNRDMDAPEPGGAVAGDLSEALKAVRRVGHQAPPCLESGRRVLERELDRASKQQAHRVQPERELDHDAEVPATAAQSPKELRSRLFARRDDSAVRCDDPRGKQVVERQPERGRQVPDPAAERQSGYAGVAERPTRHCEPVPLAGRVDVFPQSASSARHRTLLRIDRDVPHQAEIHDKAVVAHAVPSDAVATAAHGNRQARLSRIADRRRDVLDVERPGDELRPPVEHPVEGAPCRVVAAVVGRDHRAAVVRPQIGER